MKKTVILIIAIILMLPVFVKASCAEIFKEHGVNMKNYKEVTCNYTAEYNKRIFFFQSSVSFASFTMNICCPENVKIGDRCYINSMSSTNSDGQTTVYRGSFADSYPVAGTDSGCMASLQGETNWYDHFFGTEYPMISLVECKGDSFCYKLDGSYSIDPSSKYEDIELCRTEDPNYIRECACMPAALADLTSGLFNLLKIIAPTLLLIVGGFELIKAMTAQDEKAIKKAQDKLIKKFIAAAAIFLVVTAIQFLVSALVDDPNDVKNTLKCINYLLNGYNV